MFILIIILLLSAIILFTGTYLHRRNLKEEQKIIEIDSGCCGAHAVCEKEFLLNAGNKAVYYDDEELDALAGISPDDYTAEQTEIFSDIFYTLKEKDVSGWLRSLQIRRIQLPESLRDEALLIVRERRGL